MWKTTLFLKTKYGYFLLVLAFFVLASCKNQDTLSFQEEGKQVAKVGDAILYEKEIESLVSKEAGSDSLALRDRFINNWIRKELLLQTAKMNLTEKEQDVEAMVKDYKASLLINQYKQKYLAEHLDTLVTEEDVAMYVAEYPDNFVLQEPLFRYYLAKIMQKNSGDIKFVRSLFSQKEINLMQDFKLQSTTVISNYDFDWYTINDILRSLPAEMSKKELKNLKEGSVFVAKDSIFTYLVRPLEIIKEGEMSPQEYINDKVREIILHNRKIALAKQLEYEIYEVAKTKNQFEVY